MVVEGVFEGLPYKGPPLDLKKTDDPEKVFKLEQRLHVRIFELWKGKDLEEYGEVCSKVNDGVALLSVEEREYVEEKHSWVVLLRWIEQWYTAAEEPMKGNMESTDAKIS